MTTVTFEFENLDEIQAKLRNPDLINKPMERGLEQAALVGRNASRTAIDGGTGLAVRSISHEVEATSARVFTAIAQDRAMSIDQGRAAGANVRSILPQIIRWRDAMGIGESAIVVAQEIAARGARGKDYKQAALNAVQSDFLTVVSEMSQEFVTVWTQS